DYAILAGVAERLGFGDTFTEGRTADEWVEYLYQRYRKTDRAAPDYQTFRRDGMRAHEEMAQMGLPWRVFLEDFRADPVTNPLSTHHPARSSCSPR
ncbi:MAG: hypothetical protein AAF547_21785, partial [Actinomycetota bacterium]